MTENIQNIGFEYITDWVFKDDRVKPASLDWEEISGWIYAFVTEDKIRYIGMTETVLRTRLDQYSYQKNKQHPDTSDRVRGYIQECLDQDITVNIYGLEQPEKSKPEIEALETELINKFDPDWNRKK